MRHVPVESAQTVRCDSCGDRFELSPRRMRAHRARGTLPVCLTCRRPNPRPSPPSDALTTWWLERFTFGELRELAAAIWPASGESR